jgi:hypothetical protein
MPCYCDTPDENNQAEIEKRCKTRMYFDVQELLTSEQFDECEKRNLKRFPMININEQLCQLCKVITDEQMKKISAYHWQIKWSHKSLYDWHCQHCKDDEVFNKGK